MTIERQIKGLLASLAALILAACATTATDEAVDGPVRDPAFETAAGEATYHLLAAEMARERGLYDTAVEEYGKAAALSDDVSVAARATTLAFDLGRDDWALKSARRWVALDPQDPQAHRLMSQLYVRTGDVDRAVDSMRTLIGLKSEAPEDAFLPLSSVLLSEDNAREAADAMKIIVAEFSDVPEAHYSLGVLALRAGDFELAQESALTASELNPEWAHASLLYARTLITAGKIEEGIDYAAERIGGQNEVSERLEYGILLAAVDRDEEARVVLEQVLFDEPQNPSALRSFGLLDIKEGDLDGAQASFTALLATGRSTYEAFYYLASIAESKNQPRRAYRLYSQVAAGPNAVASQLRAARLRASFDGTEAALIQLDEFAAANPRYMVDMALGQGELLGLDDQNERALELYDTLLQQYPDDTRVQYARAFLLEKMDRVDDALHQLRIILAADPADPNALNALGYTLADRTDRIDEAHELLQKAYEGDPNSPAIIDSLGWVEFRRGNLVAARDLLVRAYQLLPDAEIAAHLGEVLWTMGEETAAREIWDEALARFPDDRHITETKLRLVP